MRLLNTTTGRLVEFIGDNVPRYAILSHRWEDEEVTFKDLENLQDGGERKKKGYSKIQGCCNQAITDGYEWVWIDNCCIDKSSSAELSEAINSMFRWYKGAQVCYAYLSDVAAEAIPIFQLETEISHSKWFQRGWTLQELLTPKHLVFFNKNWQSLGTKDDLEELIIDITGIRDIKNFMGASVAQKMSWASNRETTRIEDRAYSLFGLFAVNLPPLYGEGQNAFLRLQLEILRTSDDESIFTWKDGEDVSGGLLARSPSAFKECGRIRRKDFDIDRPAYLMTNKGLRMEASLCPSPDPSSLSEGSVDDTFCVELNCELPDDDWAEKRLAIRLRGLQGDQYARISTGDFIQVPIFQTPRITSREFSEPFSQETIPSRILPTWSTVHVKQRDDGESPFRGPYTFNIPTALLIKNGLLVSQRYLTNKYRSRWERGLVGEERLRTDTLGPRGMAAVLKFVRLGEALENSGAVDTFALVVNVYDYRVRMRIIYRRDREWDECVKETNFTFNEVIDQGTLTGQQNLWAGKLPSLSYRQGVILGEHIYNVRFSF
jgi:hypothetical protein